MRDPLVYAAIAAFHRATWATPAQIAAALISDFQRCDDADGPGLRWHIRACGWVDARTVDVRGPALDAWRAVARAGRAEKPGPADTLLAPRASGRPWDARSVRYAIQRGGAGAGANGAARDGGEGGRCSTCGAACAACAVPAETARVRVREAG